MADVLTNKCSFTLGAAITSSTQTSITRTSATDGLPGDSNGPASGTYVFVMTDGTNYELARVTGGQGTTTLTIARAVEAIGGTQTALASVPNGTVCYAIMPASFPLPNPLTSQGDLIVGGAAGAPTRLGVPGPSLILGTATSPGAAQAFGGGEATTLLTTSAGFVAGTVGGWVKSTQTTFGPLVSQRQNANTTDGALTLSVGGFYGGSGGCVQFGVNAANNAFATMTAGNLVNDGKWHFVVGTFSGTSGSGVSTGAWAIYIDGSAVGTSGSLAGTVNFPLTSLQDFSLGADSGGALAGSLAHCFVIEGTALSGAQVASLYANGGLAAFEAALLALSPTAYWEMQEASGTTATDASGNGWTGTYTGAVSPTAGPLASTVTVEWESSLSTAPAAATSVALTSGTAYQNTSGSDVMVSVPVAYAATSSAAATCEVQRGSASPGTTIGTISKAAASLALTEIEEFFLPTGWYLTLTLTNATFPSNATVQPI